MASKLPYKVTMRRFFISDNKGYDWECLLCGKSNRGFDWRRNALTQARGHVQDEHGYSFTVDAHLDGTRDRFIILFPGQHAPVDPGLLVVEGFSYVWKAA